MRLPRYSDNPKAYMHAYYLAHKAEYAERSRRYAKAHPDRCVASSRKYRLGLTTEEQKKVLRGRCKICRERKATHIDHSHVTGMVRGGLCNNCNAGLGFFQDRKALLRRAVQYLEKA